MKIGFFTNSYRPLMYGSATSVESFRVALEKLGHEVFVFAPKFWGYQQQNPKVIEYPSIMYGYKIKYPLPFTWLPSVRNRAKELKIDLVHSHHPFSVGQDGLRAAKEMGIPLIFTHHARYADYTHYVLPILPQKMIKNIIQGKVTRYANKCDRVLAPSESIKKYIQQHDVKTKVEVVSTGIEWDRFQIGNGGQVRKKFGIGEDKKVILSLGRLDQEKNLEYLTQAVAQAMKNDDNSVFLVVGEGSSMETMKKIIGKEGLSSRVIFTGLVDQKMVQDYYAVGDVFVCASKTETQGMTITEAMAAGLPIVALDATGISDQVENGQTGFLVDESGREFSEKLKHVLANENLRRQIGERAREAAKQMDIMNQARKLEYIYKEVCSK